MNVLGVVAATQSGEASAAGAGPEAPVDRHARRRVLLVAVIAPTITVGQRRKAITVCAAI